MAEGVETKHPDYLDRADEWLLMRRCYRGTKAIREQRELYLPRPGGFVGRDDYYESYLQRTKFPEIVKPTIGGMVGIIHRTEAQITMPDAMKPLEEKATKEGLPLEVFHRKITTELLMQSRYGVLADAPGGDGGTPFLAGYAAERIINWADDGSMFVLDETANVRDGFTWTPKKKFRVLQLTPQGAYQQVLYENGGSTNIDPAARGEKPIEGSIPFAIGGALEIGVPPQDLPLLGVAESAIAIYQMYADYRFALFMTGQETLFIIGLPDTTALPTVFGPAVAHGLPIGCDAKYVGTSGVGIEKTKQAIQDEREEAVDAGAKMFEGGPKGAEAAEAMRIRLAAQTANLVTVAQSSSAILERGLRNAAVFMGLDPNTVVVKPNPKLVDNSLTPAEGSELVKQWQSSAISYLTLYENLQRGGIASEERTAEEEKALIEQENPLGTGNPNDFTDGQPQDGAPPAQQ